MASVNEAKVIVLPHQQHLLYLAKANLLHLQQGHIIDTDTMITRSGQYFGVLKKIANQTKNGVGYLSGSGISRDITLTTFLKYMGFTLSGVLFVFSKFRVRENSERR